MKFNSIVVFLLVMPLWCLAMEPEKDKTGTLTGLNAVLGITKMEQFSEFYIEDTGEENKEDIGKTPPPFLFELPKKKQVVPKQSTEENGR